MNIDKVMAWIEFIMFAIFLVGVIYLTESKNVLYSSIAIYGLFQLIQIKHNTDK